MRRAVIHTTVDPIKPRFVIRLWLDGHDLGYADHAILVAVDVATMKDSPAGAAHAIADLVPHVNAVEVLDADGNGSLVYPEWP